VNVEHGFVLRFLDLIAERGRESEGRVADANTPGAARKTSVPAERSSGARQ